LSSNSKTNLFGKTADFINVLQKFHGVIYGVIRDGRGAKRPKALLVALTWGTKRVIFFHLEAAEVSDLQHINISTRDW
jgi:hypothetical protein